MHQFWKFRFWSWKFIIFLLVFSIPFQNSTIKNIKQQQSIESLKQIKQSTVKIYWNYTNWNPFCWVKRGGTIVRDAHSSCPLSVSGKLFQLWEDTGGFRTILEEGRFNAYEIEAKFWWYADIYIVVLVTCKFVAIRIKKARATAPPGTAVTANRIKPPESSFRACKIRKWFMFKKVKLDSLSKDSPAKQK